MNKKLVTWTILNEFPGHFSISGRNSLMMLIFLMIFPLGVSAKNVIEGVITDTEEEPLSGANILISETERGAVSDAEGRFRVEDIPDGEWTLVVRFVGFAGKEVSVSLPEQSGEIIAIELEDDVVISDELLVTARMFDRVTRYQPASSFDAEEIQQRNTTSLGVLLDGESGVAMRSLGQAPARPVIRGMDGERIQVLQNGMKMGDISSTAHDHAVATDPQNIDQVDIVRGPASLIYGSSAMGGVVNLRIADIPQQWSPGLSGHIGSEGQTGMESLAGRVRLNYGSEKNAFTFRSSLRNSGDINTPSGKIPDTYLESLDIGAGMARRSANHFGGFAVSYTDQEYGIPEDPFDLDEQVYLTMQRLALQGRYNRSLDHDIWDGIELRTVYSIYTHEEIGLEFEDREQVDRDLELGVDQHYFQADILAQHGQAGLLTEGTAGATVEYRDVTVGGDEALTPNARVLTLGGYLVEEFRLYDNWRLQGGVRVEWNRTESLANADFHDADEIRSRGVWAGAAGISGPLIRNINAGLQFSRAHRTPSVEELFSDAPHLAAGAYEIGDPGLGNEIGYGLDFFLDYEAGNWQLHAAVFGNRISNYITRTPTGDRYEPRDLPVLRYEGTDADILGFEASVKHNVTDRLSITGQADYTRGTERATGDNQPLPFMPPLRVTGKTEYDSGPWWIRATVRHAFEQSRVAPEEEATDGYTLFEANAGVSFGNDYIHQISAGMENAFDVTWRDHLSRIEQRDIPMMGRNVRLSYRLVF